MTPFDIDAFAEAMSQPWTCCRCRRTFTPTPDDADSVPVALETKYVPDPNRKGEFIRKKVGDICGNCMRSPKPPEQGIVL